MLSQKYLEEWAKNPTVNPKTGRKISPQGAIYKKYEKELFNLIDSVSVNNTRVYYLKQWAKHPTVNPKTGRVISTEGLIYKQFKKEYEKEFKTEFKKECKNPVNKINCTIQQKNSFDTVLIKRLRQKVKTPAIFTNAQPCLACPAIFTNLNDLYNHIKLMSVTPKHYKIYKNFYN